VTGIPVTNQHYARVALTQTRERETERERVSSGERGTESLEWRERERERERESLEWREGEQAINWKKEEEYARYSPLDSTRA